METFLRFLYMEGVSIVDVDYKSATATARATLGYDKERNIELRLSDERGQGRLLAAVSKHSSVLAMFDEANKVTWEAP